MTKGQKIGLITGVLAIAGAAFFLLRQNRKTEESPRSITIEGAVIRQDSDPHKQAPLEGAAVLLSVGGEEVKTNSDASGYFKARIQIPPGAGFLSARITHSDYYPLELSRQPADQLLLARMEPILGRRSEAPRHEEVQIKDVRVRYTVKLQNRVNVGYAAKSFIVQNLGDVACDGQPPCSPDGKWKAATGSLTLDAGEGNEFANARVSCIAGPCPFTKVTPLQMTSDLRHANTTATTWSDTATFLVEAEVSRVENTSMVRHSFPVIFGPSMNFTLPGTAEGPSIEAALNGTDIVFPLGPALILSWGTCSMEVARNGTRIYRCELKPGYTF